MDSCVHNCNEMSIHTFLLHLKYKHGITQKVLNMILKPMIGITSTMYIALLGVPL